jgi:transposase-like protein
MGSDFVCMLHGVTFFKDPAEIRTLIYTTNPIESLNRGLNVSCSIESVTRFFSSDRKI